MTERSEAKPCPSCGDFVPWGSNDTGGQDWIYCRQCETNYNRARPEVAQSRTSEVSGEPIGGWIDLCTDTGYIGWFWYGLGTPAREAITG